jgi:hypothetical protein
VLSRCLARCLDADSAYFAVLDPRITFGGLRQAYTDDIDMTADLLKSQAEFRKYFLATYASDSARLAQERTSSSSSRPPALNRFFARFTAAGGSAPSQGPEAELDALFQLRAESIETCPDPVQWWGVHRARFPLLSRLARDILSIPGSPSKSIN